jgi:peptidoglycan/xylan/chitin deacetylase (PgdA/CDA1 family)
MSAMQSAFWARAHGRYQRSIATSFFKRPFTISSSTPFISFTFDDFPRTALTNGGPILQRCGLTGTYYASLGLMGTQAPAGPLFVKDDLESLLEQGHELGCHTFDHRHSWNTSPAIFERSIAMNSDAIGRLRPGARLSTFSYPMSPPRARTKRMTSAQFVCCRGGGQTFNAGTTDLNYLQAYFLEKAHGDAALVRDLIDENRRQRGWLILATHDVTDDPSPFGCTPQFFEDIVGYAVDSGACILPVIRAYEALRATT